MLETMMYDITPRDTTTCYHMLPLSTTTYSLRTLYRAWGGTAQVWYATYYCILHHQLSTTYYYILLRTTTQCYVVLHTPPLRTTTYSLRTLYRAWGGTAQGVYGGIHYPMMYLLAKYHVLLHTTSSYYIPYHLIPPSGGVLGYLLRR